MNWAELDLMLQRHGLSLELVDKLELRGSQAPPAEMVEFLRRNADPIKTHLQVQRRRQDQSLPPQLQSLLRLVSNQGTGMAGVVKLPSGIVTDFDTHVMANATAYLVQPSAHLMHVLQTACEAWTAQQH